MHVICISRSLHSGGTELAGRLAEKLGSACLSREALIGAAVKEGIQVGKLEMAMVKPGRFSERLAVEKEHYQAFSTGYLCERAAEGTLVYHGRTGHLLLSGVSHVLRVRVVTSREKRIASAMQKLGLNREKAQTYLDDVEEDIRRWVQSMYGMAWDDHSHFDMIVNLEKMSIESAAAALVSVAQLPDFMITPASKMAMDDLWLAARARVLLARDKRTYGARFKVRASDGTVNVTYLPQDAGMAEAVQAVIEPMEGVAQLSATMAATNILWIQETFDSGSDAFREVVEIATKWNAAVELIRLVAGVEVPGQQEPSALQPPGEGDGPAPESGEFNGGIEDDTEDKPDGDDGGLKSTLDELARLGRSGAGRTVVGGSELLLDSIDRTIPYTLVVVGDVFSDKGHAVRVRMKRELQGMVSEAVRVSAVGSEELKSQYLFGGRDFLYLLALVALTAVIFFLVFSHQQQVLSFLTAAGTKARLLAAGAVVLFVPLVAYLYGSAAKLLMKMIKME